MRISDWSSDVCSSDLSWHDQPHGEAPVWRSRPILLRQSSSGQILRTHRHRRPPMSHPMRGASHPPAYASETSVFPTLRHARTADFLRNSSSRSFSLLPRVRSPSPRFLHNLPPPAPTPP